MIYAKNTENKAASWCIRFFILKPIFFFNKIMSLHDSFSSLLGTHSTDTFLFDAVARIQNLIHWNLWRKKQQKTFENIWVGKFLGSLDVIQVDCAKAIVVK